MAPGPFDVMLPQHRPFPMPAPFPGPYHRVRRPWMPPTRMPMQRWNPAWQPQAPLNMNDRVLRQCLPKIAQGTYEIGMPPDHVASQYANCSQEVEENCGLLGLSVRDLLEVYRTILDEINRGADESNIAIMILSILDRQLEEDGLHLQRQRGFGFSRALRTFRAMAEVSSQTYSSWLGYLLSDFFLSNGHSIIEDSDTDSLAFWAFAIRTSAMRDDDKIRCLELIISYGSEVVEYLRRHQYLRLHMLGRELEDLLDEATYRNFNLQSRNFRRPRTVRRSSVAPLHRRRSTSLRPMGSILGRSRSYSDLHDLHRQLDRVRDAADLLSNEVEITKDVASDRSRV